MRSVDNSRNAPRTIGDMLPETGPLILAAAKILLELNPQDQARGGSVEAELANLDEWVETHCGPQAFSWAEYWEYRGALENLAGGKL